VRLKEYQPDRFVTFDAISIPSGAIKSFHQIVAIRLNAIISIPSGAIKRSKS